MIIRDKGFKKMIKLVTERNFCKSYFFLRKKISMFLDIIGQFDFRTDWFGLTGKYKTFFHFGIV